MCLSGNRWSEQKLSPQRQTNPLNPVFLLQKAHLVIDFFGVFFGDALDEAGTAEIEGGIESTASIISMSVDPGIKDVWSVNEEAEAAAAAAVSFSLLATTSFTRSPTLSLLTGGGRMSSLSFRESDILFSACCNVVQVLRERGGLGGKSAAVFNFF